MHQELEIHGMHGRQERPKLQTRPRSSPIGSLVSETVGSLVSETGGSISRPRFDTLPRPRFDALLSRDSAGALPWDSWARRLIAALKKPWCSDRQLAGVLGGSGRDLLRNPGSS